ncbi:MAG: DUF402 domain-containing protein [Gemmatimonadetes bacterium]|nr:DUF402 domain-containing protein [Gemmatimonadota bacterium]
MSGPLMAKRIRIHYYRPGKGTIVYHEHLVLDRPDVKVTLLAEYTGDEVYAGDQRILDAGAPIVWYIFPKEWRDIGRFHLSDATFTGWYTNLCVPTQVEGLDWKCTDLFLDHWLPVSGAPMWLDEDEFRLAVDRGLIDPATERRVLEERDRVDAHVAAGEWPPSIAREIDLAAALEALRQ